MAQTKPKRLPPQPTDTALARHVRSIIDRLPGATIGAWNALSAHAARLQRQLYRADEDNQRLHGELVRVKKDIRRMMAPVPPPRPLTLARIIDDPFEPSPFITVSVEYMPMRFAMNIGPNDLRKISRGELSPASIAALREAANDIARTHAQHHAAEILRVTLETLTKKDAANG